MSNILPAGQGPYQSGNPITLEALFVHDTSPVDPATVVFNLRLPDDTLVTYTYGVDGEVTNPSVGEYLCALPTTWLPGQTYYEAVATDPDVTLPGEFYVVASSVIVPALPKPNEVIARSAIILRRREPDFALYPSSFNDLPETSAEDVILLLKEAGHRLEEGENG